MRIELDYESSVLKTINTPIGHFRWLHLPFGIKSAPEIYQHVMNNMLEGIDRAHDILIAGKDPKHHDEVMKAVNAELLSGTSNSTSTNARSSSHKSSMLAIS